MQLTGGNFVWKCPFYPSQNKNPDLDNYASESGYYCHFQRASQRLVPIHRKLLVGLCRQFDQHAVGGARSDHLESAPEPTLTAKRKKFPLFSRQCF